MELICANFALRPWRPGDETALAKHANDREVWINLNDRFPHPYTRADAVAWVGRPEARQRPPMTFAIAIGEEAVGRIGMRRLDDVHRKVAEIGYWLGRAHWGKGIATEALKRVTTYAFESFDIERLQARVFDRDAASCRVLEKAGYELEARLKRSVLKDGEILDALVYARLRHPPGA